MPVLKIYDGEKWVEINMGIASDIYVLVDGTRGLTNTLSGVAATHGYDFVILNQSGDCVWNAAAISGIPVVGAPTYGDTLRYDGLHWVPSGIN